MKLLKMSIVMAVIIGIGLSGCIKNAKISKQFTSSNIGCETKDIEIFDETAGFNGMHTWTAKCKGRTYICTYHSSAGSKCKELIE